MGRREAKSWSQNPPQDSPKSANTRWIQSVLPYSIALGPVSTVVQLLILNFHGTVIDVGIAVTLYNAVIIPASIVWGFITDRFHKRKPLIMLSYLLTAGLLVAFFFAGTVYSVSLLYAMFSLATTASTTPLNLLVMETERKQRWATGFARLSMITSIGQTVGLLLSMTWTLFSQLSYIVIVLAIFSLISAGLSVLMIKEPAVIFERQVIAMTKQSLFERLKTASPFFLRIPRLNDFKRMFRALRYDLTRKVPLLYFSIFGFYLASGIFNTSMVPSLQANQISSLLIFFVTTIGMLVQIVSFKYAGPYTEKMSPSKASIVGLALRSIAYGIMGVFVFAVSGIWFLVAMLIFYPLAAGLAYAIYYTASNTMVFNTLGNARQGSSLGVYSALVGIAMMVGSLISGFTSFYIGYYATFILAAVFLAISSWLISILVHQQVT
jgi:MFS family permease